MTIDKRTDKITKYTSKVTQLALKTDNPDYIRKFFNFKDYLPSSKPLLFGKQLPEEDCLGLIKPTYMAHQIEKHKISLNYVLDIAEVNGDL